ncbi:MAG: ferredoxin-NADP reductase [Sandaracinaceae bacterium]
MSEAVMRVEDMDSGARFRGKVVSSERITSPASEDEVREIVIDVEGPSLRVGQSIGVLAPGEEELGGADHLRLYTVADLPTRGPNDESRIKIAVKRVTYIDEYSGERYDGVASNYLCNRREGDDLELTGPYEHPFQVPHEHDATLVLIGQGTGIAPFRALVKHIYADVKDWTGQIWLFYGARSGLELLYMNDEKDDFAQYYDRDTFEAFRAVSPRPHWSAPIAWEETIEERGQVIWDALGSPKTYVYVAGLEELRPALDKVFTKLAGSEEAWERRLAELMAGERWVELLY